MFEAFETPVVLVKQSWKWPVLPKKSVGPRALEVDSDEEVADGLR